MDIWQMRYFIQVYNDKSFTKAAKNLYISQQGLSKTIKNLEDEFQIKLFERSAKGIKPTEYADMLIEKSWQIVKDYDEMTESLNQKIVSQKKSISIGVTNILYNNYLSSFICNFKEENPDVILEIVELGTYACEKHLENNLVDICFTVNPDDTLMCEFIPVSVFDMVLLVNKQNPIYQKDDIMTQNLKNEKFIMLSTDFKIRKLTIDHCLQSGFYPDITITTSQMDFIIEQIALNNGIAILPSFSSDKVYKMSKDIAVLPLNDNTPFQIEVGFLINKHKVLNNYMNTLIDYILNKNNIK